MQIIQMPSGARGSGQAAQVSVRRVVVPVDGTLYAERAFPTAITLAHAWNAEIILVRADVARVGASGRSSHPPRRYERETAQYASLYLARAEQEVRAQGVRVSSRLLVGMAAEAILAAVAECDADLVVMSTHAGGFANLSHTSVARKVLLGVDIPTLLLTSSTRSPFDLPVCPGLTLVALLEHARANAAALPLATLVARTFAGQLLLLGAAALPTVEHRGVEGAPLPHSSLAAARTEAILYLERQRSHLESAQVPVWTAVVDGDLLEEAADLGQAGADILVLTAQSSPQRRTYTVEAALRLLKRCNMPVLVVPERRHLRMVSPSPLGDDAGVDALCHEEDTDA